MRVTRWLAGKTLFALFALQFAGQAARAAPDADPAALADRAREALVRVMQEDQAWPKIHAAEMLVASGDGPRVREYFLGELAGREPAACRLGVWRVLADTSRTSSDRAVWVAKIEAVLLDPAAADRLGAVETLAKLNHRCAGRALEQVRAMEAKAAAADQVIFWWLRQWAGEKDPMEKLTAGLASGDPVVRRRCGYVLRWLRTRDTRALEALVRAARGAAAGSDEAVFLAGAVLALHADEAGTAEWTKLLVEAMQHGSSAARYDAAQVLATRVGAKDVGGLMPLLDHADADTRVAAARVILAGLRRDGAGDGRVITLGPVPLLFVDDVGVESRRNLVRRYHAGTPRAEPILTGEKPWEGERVYVYGTVRRDPVTRKFEMWYIGVPARGEILTDTGKVFVEGFREGGAALLLYATSDDGLHWNRPELGLHAFAGSKANNILFDLDSVNVVRDEREPDAARRYKLVGYSGGGYWSAVSPDGLRWKDSPAHPILSDGDTVTMARDPQTGEFLVYHKKPSWVRGFDRRVVWLSRSKDFEHWSEPRLVLEPDEIDDAWCTRPEERTEFYNLSVFPHAGGYIGLPTVFRVEYELPRGRTGPGQSRWNGPIDVEIASSADGEKWQRAYPRINLIPHGAPGAFNSGAILGLASDPVNVGAETWIYYSVLTTDHGGPMPPKKIAIARADWRRDGFVSLEVGPEGGALETRPVRFAAPQLVVNADMQRGSLRAAIVELDGSPIAGLGIEDAEVLTADAIGAVMRWKSGRQPPTDRAVRVRLELRSGRLFSVGSARPE